MWVLLPKGRGRLGEARRRSVGVSHAVPSASACVCTFPRWKESDHRRGLAGPTSLGISPGLALLSVRPKRRRNLYFLIYKMGLHHSCLGDGWGSLQSSNAGRPLRVLPGTLAAAGNSSCGWGLLGERGSTSLGRTRSLCC